MKAMTHLKGAIMRRTLVIFTISQYSSRPRASWKSEISKFTNFQVYELKVASWKSAC